MRRLTKPQRIALERIREDGGIVILATAKTHQGRRVGRRSLEQLLALEVLRPSGDGLFAGFDQTATLPEEPA